jgi:hypothetical protein
MDSKKNGRQSFFNYLRLKSGKHKIVPIKNRDFLFCFSSIRHLYRTWILWMETHPSPFLFVPNLVIFFCLSIGDKIPMLHMVHWRQFYASLINKNRRKPRVQKCHAQKNCTKKSTTEFCNLFLQIKVRFFCALREEKGTVPQ